MVGGMTDSSAAMQNMEEEEAILGSLEIGSATRECLIDVKETMEEEIVSNGEPLFTPNASLDLAPPAAVSADPLFQTAMHLE